jgi:hypothetical protein
MSLPNPYPFNELVVTAKTASVATSPAAAYCVAPARGLVVRTYAVIEGTITGTAAIAVGINGGADIGTGALSIAAGNAGSPASDTPANANQSARVNEGDVISFTPSGAGGASIPATFQAVIRERSA